MNSEHKCSHLSLVTELFYSQAYIPLCQSILKCWKGSLNTVCLHMYLKCSECAQTQSLIIFLKKEICDYNYITI